ncbi:hypothetical protein, partial [Vibrio sp. V23_P3S9T160]|uniref:hypothetical protein n=1 Tax=Vibrio sp. V23_P3S9T160 TaxID=1938675 RepID=UPI001F29EAED
ARTAINEPPKQSPPFNNQQAFEGNKPYKQDFQQVQNARLTCPFHTLRTLNWQQTSTNSLRQTKNLACFTV